MTEPSPLVLTPPDPVPQVRTEEVSGLVPLDESVREELRRRAVSAVASLTQLDPRTPEFAARIAEVTSVGAREMRTAAGQSGRILDRSVRSLARGAEGGHGDAQARVADSLVELRRTVVDLDPTDVSTAATVRRLLSKLPGVNRYRDHLARYASAQDTLERIVQGLQSGQDELIRDSATLQTERARLWETMGKLQEYVVLVDALDRELQSRIDELGASERVQADALRADVLFPVRQKHQDLLTQLAVCAQGYLAMNVVRRNTDELVKGVERAMTTTMTALRIGVMLSTAMENQRKVTKQVTILRGTTEDLVATNAALLGRGTDDVHRLAADPALGAETLHEAFQQIYRTLDAIDTYRAQATDSMALSVRTLTTELAGASGHLARSHAADDPAEGRS